jgi:hypothetical protein
VGFVRNSISRRPIFVAAATVFLILGAASIVNAHESASAAENQTIGPLDEFRNVIFAPDLLNILSEPDLQVAQEQANLLVQRQNEFLIACMEEQDFTFYPFEEILPLAPIPDTVVPSGSRQWAESYGFGISTSPRWQSALWQVDPNHSTGTRTLDMLEGMSQAEQIAWNFAYWGYSSSRQPDEVRSRWEGVPFDEIPNLEIGCMNRIAREAPWANAEFGDTPFSWLRDEILGFDNVVQADPRTLTLNASWSLCLAETGYPGWNSPAGLRPVLLAAWEKDYLVSPETLVAWDWVSAPDGPPVIEAADFVLSEIALAVADWDCRNSLGYDAALQAINLDLQQQFVDKHRSDLELWKNSAAS